uniref:RING-type domain-containing protein n=1 Tax=Pyrodinium bahamense TaxID=73915 RepID=A0A7S0AGZ2_9DINO
MALAHGSLAVNPSTVAGTAVIVATSVADEVPQWEWCKIAGPNLGRRSLADLDRSDWGIYSEAQNEQIEAAFQAGHKMVEVIVGIRTYHIIFDGVFTRNGGMVQHDLALNKTRHVRRRLVLLAERTAALSAAMERQTLLAGEELCAICVEHFAENPVAPIVRLPCGHSFHGACVQRCAGQTSAASALGRAGLPQATQTPPACLQRVVHQESGVVGKAQGETEAEPRGMYTGRLMRAMRQEVLHRLASCVLAPTLGCGCLSVRSKGTSLQSVRRLLVGWPWTRGAPRIQHRSSRRPPTGTGPLWRCCCTLGQTSMRPRTRATLHCSWQPSKDTTMWRSC